MRVSPIGQIGITVGLLGRAFHFNAIDTTFAFESIMVLYSVCESF